MVVVLVFPVADDYSSLGQDQKVLMLPMSRWRGRLVRSLSVLLSWLLPVLRPVDTRGPADLA